MESDIQPDQHKTLLVRIGVVVVVLAALFLAYRLIQYARTTITTHVPIVPGETPTPTPEPDPALNILLLGYGGAKHDGPYLTDSMMVARFDDDRQSVFLLSLPRDVWVTLPTSDSGTPQKLNAAYAIGLDDQQYPDKPERYTGGPSGARAMVKDVVHDVTGLTITHVVALDFEGFIKSIDLLGGVDVAVPQTFEDKEYPIEGKETDLCGKEEKVVEEELKTATSAAIVFPCRYETIAFTKGTVHMDGETALKYVRSRHGTNGSDFSRSERQRAVINAVKAKALSLNILPKLPELYRTLSSHIATDISPADLPSFISKLTTWSTYTISSIGLSTTNVLQEDITSKGLYALFSVEGEGKWDLVRQYLYSLLRPEKDLNVALIQLRGVQTERSRLKELSDALLKTNMVVTDITYVSPKEATQSAFIVNNSRTISQKVMSGLEKMITPLSRTTSTKTLPYDGILTVAPLPTPTPTPASLD